ncbi:MAG: hypothetical protein JNL01_05200 [Bdellovibrionales bacterium]|nr:hypothetical protein [Bdellovibrionales bacterium]
MLLLKMSLRPWRQAPLTQILSVLSMGALLTIAAMLFHLENGLTPLVHRLQSEQVITAYLDSSVRPEDESKISDSIQLQLGARPSQVQAVSVQEFIDRLGDTYPDLAREVQGFGAETHQLVPRHFSITGIFSQAAAEKLSQIPGIESVETSRDRHIQIVSGFKAIRWVARVLVIGLAFALLSALVYMAQANSSLHRDVVDLMTFWGASPGMAKAPIFLSGLWIGTVGGIAGLVFWNLCGSWLFRQLTLLSPLLSDFPQPTWMASVAVALGGIALGIFSGGFARK